MLFYKNKLWRALCGKPLILLLLTIIAGTSACRSGRNLTYLSDLNASAVDRTAVTNNTAPKIQPGDLLSIVVNSLSVETNTLFNSGGALPATAAGVGEGAVAASARASEGYLVDSNGDINYPTVGKLKLAGLTKEEATAKITAIVSKFAKVPVVTIRYLNFRVTVIGEVNRPGTFTIPTEKINILEALGLAGDMTGYGKRENVLIIREHDNTRTTTRLNLNNKAVLSSPFYYLEQNDIVYVEPDKAKALQVSTRTVNLPIYLSVASILAVLLVNLR